MPGDAALNGTTSGYRPNGRRRDQLFALLRDERRVSSGAHMVRWSCERSVGRLS